MNAQSDPPGASAPGGADDDDDVRLWRVFDRPWNEDDTARYIRRAANGVLLSSRSATDFAVLDFLATLPNLRHLEIDAPIRKDAFAFELTDLVSLSLFTAAKHKFDLLSLRHLKDLALRSRPGLEAISGAASLQSLMIGGYRGADLEFLSPMPKLRSLRVDCKNSALSLRGVERCQGLAHLVVHDAVVESLAPLRALDALVELVIVGVPGKPSPTPWDLNDITHLRQLRELRLPSSGPVASLSPLRQLHSIETLKLPSGVLDGDYSLGSARRDRG